MVSHPAIVLLLLWTHATVSPFLPCENVREKEPFSEGEVIILVLVPWPDERNFAGWDEGYAMLAAGRVAQKEVNEDASLLPNHTVRLIERGHEACGLYETSCGVRNLVEYSIDPLHAVAVAGLYCSASTAALSGLAGREEINLVQLTASNSPTFEARSNLTRKFPRQWKFLESASIYADMIIDLMDHFNWSNIALVQDFDSIFYATIGEVLNQQIDTNLDKQIIYTTSIFDNSELIDDSLRNIRNTSTRIIVAIASSSQLAELLCSADKYEIRYPDYMWIIIDFLPEHLEREKRCSPEQLHRVLNGSLMAYFNLDLENSTTLVSGKPYSKFLELYQKELENVREEFEDPDLEGDPLYGGLLYDQIWALSLALNNSLSEIRDSNISLTDLGLNRLEITEIIEEEFLMLDFQGATNRIKFTEERDIFTSIDIYQIVGKEPYFVGGYYQNRLINLSLDRFDDKVESMDRVIEKPLAITLYAISGVVTVWVFIMMCLLIHYRNKSEIKATSPVLSLLMYVGCYCLCLASFGRILLGTITDELFYTVNCNVQVFLFLNGFNFLFLTLIAKLLRINAIFNNASLKQLGKVWNNSVLATGVCLIALASNSVLVVWFSLDPLRQENSTEFIIKGNRRYNEVDAKCVSQHSLIWYIIYIAYQIVVIFVTVVVTVLTRRIPYENFKDTKKTNLFVFIIIIGYIFFVCGWWITRELKLVDIANLFVYIILILAVIICQVALFVPKFRTLVCSSVKRRTSVVSL